tara:strand:- start:36409 stop:38610 length:2202 start_codon:yes stop_codon:yes gene_type:complete
MNQLRISDDVSVKDILLYNPYDVETNLSGKGFSEDDFQHFFYPIPEIQIYSNEIKKRITPGDYEKSVIILSGYSGSGKTTLINWFSNNLTDDYYFNITNLNSRPIGTDDIEKNILQSVITEKFKSLLKSPNAQRNLIATNKLILEELISDSMFLDKIIDFYNDIENNVKINISRINKLTQGLKFKELLLIYIIEHLNRLELDKYKSITFCFDNLDDVKFEYLTEDFWNDFLYVRSTLVSFFEKNPDQINFNFKSKFKFILTFREANLIVRSSEFLDRASPICTTIRIILSESARKIIKKRLDILNLYYRSELKKSPISYFIQIMAKSPYTDSFYLPLFNYDYRRLMFSFVEICTEHSEVRLNTIAESRYREIHKISKRIARGTLMHRMINYLFRTNKLLEFASLPETPGLLPEVGFCRKSRILLTIIYRFSYRKGIPKDEYKRKQVSPDKCTLFDIFNSYSELFPEDTEVFDLISDFFDVNQTSWTHLISVYNESNDKVKVNFSKERKLLKRIMENEYDVYKFKDKLKNYQVHINSSGYIYLRHILIHFEYFSNLINERYHKNYRSLVESIDFDSKENEFEFIVIINKVIKKLKKYKLNIDNFLSNLSKNGKTADWYLNEEYTFITEPNSQPSFYFTRVVSSHMDYIDKFRYFLFIDKRIRKNVIKNGSTIAEINKKLVLQLAEYHHLLDSGYKDQNAIIKIRENKKNIKYIYENELYNEWHPITTQGNSHKN